MNLALHLFAADRALYAIGRVYFNRTGTGARVQVERGCGRQLQMDAARSGANLPRSGRSALSLDRTAAGMRIQRTPNASQFHAARSGIHPHRARRGLLQNDVSAAR